MSGNSIGKSLVLTTFGESHGTAIGAVLDGFPPGITLDPEFIRSEISRRRTGTASFTSSRQEDDRIEFLSGIFEGRSAGTPIAFIIPNLDQRPEDYVHLRDVFRPSHADFTYTRKYGVRDHRGGGRASARETVARVAAGALVKLFLKKHGITITGYTFRIGPVSLPEDYVLEDCSFLSRSPVGCPDEKTSKKMVKYLENLQKEGDTTGGIITCLIRNVPAGLGEPVFDKLHADLAKAVMSINAAKGFEYGSGFSSASMKGSEHNDLFVQQNRKILIQTNHDGGIQGGISNGNEIPFRVAFKPVATLMKDQVTVNARGEKVLLKGKGRHDVCVIPRAVPVVEAMAALVIGDHLIRNGLR
jgi:chorismate synthase